MLSWPIQLTLIVSQINYSEQKGKITHLCFIFRVPAFEASAYLITNKQFLQFVNIGGYKNKELWSKEGWQWCEYRKVQHPAFWVCEEGKIQRGILIHVPPGTYHQQSSKMSRTTISRNRNVCPACFEGLTRGTGVFCTVSCVVYCTLSSFELYKP